MKETIEAIKRDAARFQALADAKAKRSFAEAPGSVSWLESLDRRWSGKVIPFVIGVNVGAIITVGIFIVAYFITDGK
jgi:hypothetical protein